PQSRERGLLSEIMIAGGLSLSVGFATTAPNGVRNLVGRDETCVSRRNGRLGVWSVGVPYAPVLYARGKGLPSRQEFALPAPSSGIYRPLPPQPRGCRALEQ